MLLVCAAAIALVSGLATRREMRAFIGSNLLLAGLLATGAAAIFPVVLHSTLAPENSLTAYDVAAGPNSLAYAAIWWPIGFALAAAYFVFVSRRYAGKVSVKRDNQGFYYSAPAISARRRTGLHGLLPPQVDRLAQQVGRGYEAYRRRGGDSNGTSSACAARQQRVGLLPPSPRTHRGDGADDLHAGGRAGVRANRRHRSRGTRTAPARVARTSSCSTTACQVAPAAVMGLLLFSRWRFSAVVAAAVLVCFSPPMRSCQPTSLCGPRPRPAGDG